MKSKIQYSKYYELEKYLFTDINQRFHSRGYLNPDEFYCIIIWKSNRSKSRIVKKLGGNYKFGAKVISITSQVFKAKEHKNKMSILMSNGFRLPIASAILSVLYPDQYSVYDYRVCEILQAEIGALEYIKIQSWTFDRLWKGYNEYLRDVLLCSGKSDYRSADKYLWGKSFFNQNCKSWIIN